MRRRNEIIMEYGTYMLAYFVSYIASLARLYYISGLLLLLEAIYLYLHWVRESQNIAELRAVFTLAWVGGQGVACLRLSRFQSDWNYVTWLCFFLIYIGFGIGYEWGRKYDPDEKKEPVRNSLQAERLFLCIVGLALVSALSFGFRKSGLGGISGSCVLIPAITILYGKVSEKKGGGEKAALVLANLTAAAIPILRMSRFHIFFVVCFTMVTYIMVNRRMRIRTMAGIVLALLPVYVALTVFRYHDVTYLNNVFDMKYGNMPIFLTQPYVYVANNFENFNCMVEQLVKHTWGMRMLSPLFALTGLKCVFPRLTPSVIFLTKPELTSLTMFYDAYYDFGIIGVFLFAALVGTAAKWMMRIVKKNNNPVAYLFYGQFAVYLGLSFFNTWFSNPIIWFWLILTGMMYRFVGYDKNRKRNGQEE
jgi:cytochrome c biogenesis protein CcdA